MVRKLISAAVLLSLPYSALATCFTARENNKIVLQEGECQARHSPMSTFKLPLLIIGLDAGILKSADEPAWEYKDEYKATWPYKRQVCEGIQTPQSWIKNSCVWYSQQITLKLGAKQFKAYADKFNYGNRDVSGDKGKNNGVTHAWLLTSLRISPLEQTMFLQNFIDEKLNVSIQSQRVAKDILALGEIEDGWKLYGKTGSGDDMDKQGWFVGWVEKDNRKLAFAQYVDDQLDLDAAPSGGLRAKKRAIERLNALMK
ncbi:MAG: penicillin-binding transpeptidase domain-containing protein [Alphaproteobacteria bacterium]|jgi:beta-lactamase class D|nr:class D beta-lactamase [Candidatus Jidaibacter sp.]